MEEIKANATQPIHVSILGSCVSRDAFSLSKNASGYAGTGEEYVVDRFIQSIHPLSAISAPVSPSRAEALIEESKSSTATNFYKRNFMLDVTKRWESYLSEVRSDWLILDLSTIRLELRSVDDTYITYDLESTVTKGIDTLPDEGALASLQNGRISDLFSISPEQIHPFLSEYFDRILSLYPAERIIVLDIHHVYTYIDPVARAVATPNAVADNRYRLEDNVIRIAYDYAKEYLKGAYFVDALPVLVGNVNHIWGRCGLHYLDEIYLYMLRAIDLITQTDAPRIQKETELSALRQKFAHAVFEIYADAANRSAAHAANLLNFASGIRAGTYEKNGLLLTVHPDSGYAVQGCATEDTIFYLYSRTQDPCGAWSSIPTELPPGLYRLTTDVEAIPERVTLQLVLSDKEKKQRWISVNVATRFTLTSTCVYILIRLIVKKGECVNLNGKMILERLH